MIDTAFRSLLSVILGKLWMFKSAAPCPMISTGSLPLCGQLSAASFAGRMRSVKLTFLGSSISADDEIRGKRKEKMGGI